MARRSRTHRAPAVGSGAPAAASTPTLWDDASDPTWSVPELGEAISLHVRTAFPDEVWVRGTIRNLSRGRQGMAWFDLVEPHPGRADAPPVATVPVVLFNQERLRVNARLRDTGNAVRMTDGTEVRLRARVAYYARGGRLQLAMSDIDPAFTLGRLAADRERVLRALDGEGLLDRQAALTMPVVPLRLGLVTSRGSAAEHDVLDELHRSGVGFTVVSVDVRVQGSHAPGSIAVGLRAVVAHDVDVVLLVRGGGATTDLAAFDGEVVARAVATLDVPVLTGIGHEIDRSVADDVAHVSYKTPTACAQAVVAAVGAVAARTEEVWHAVAVAARRHTRGEAERLRTCGRHVALATRQGLVAADRELEARSARVARAADVALTGSVATLDRAVGRVEAAGRAHLRAHDHAVATAGARLVQRSPRLLVTATRDLDAIEAQVRALDPQRVLARGWSITRTTGGRIVRSAHEVAAGDELVTTVADGSVRSTVSPDPPAAGSPRPADPAPADPASGSAP
jgi:exodeoxyribonuclease VII large subunit